MNDGQPVKFAKCLISFDTHGRGNIRKIIMLGKGSLIKSKRGKFGVGYLSKIAYDSTSTRLKIPSNCDTIFISHSKLPVKYLSS